MGQRGVLRFRPRRATGWWIAVALAVASVAASPANGASGDRRCRIRLACFNAEILAAPGEPSRLTRFRFEPARKRHLERIAAVIETLDPDILVMPEVMSRQGVDALAAILAEKGLGDLVGHHVESADAFSGLDVAVFSRLEPDEIDGDRIRIFVPRKPAEGEEPVAADAWLQERYKYMDERGNARAETAVLQRHAVVYFTVCGRKLAIFGLHLKSNPSDIGSNAQRTAETRIARDIVRREIEDRGYLPILLGDFNDYDPDVPMADATRTTATSVLRDLKDYDAGREGAELVNVAAHMPRVADRYTSHWDFNENGAADGEDVFTMIDHILVHRDLEPAIRRAFICHATGLEISDHFPVVVDLDFGALKR
jgi:endonuclease/exonuclease/phosphatase family metal-dependent hydrolase